MVGKAFGGCLPKHHPRGLSWAAIGLLLLVTTVPTLAAPSALASVIALTTAEQEWLKAHPDITFGYTDQFEPAVIVNKDGSYRGTLVDFLDLLNQRLGTDFKIMIKPIPEAFRQVSQKEMAGILSLHPDNADKRGFLKTQSYTTSYPTIFARKGLSFNAPSDLAAKRIALIDHVFFSQNQVDLHGHGSTLIKVKTALAGLEAVKNGTADIFIGSSRNSYLLGKYQFFDLAAVFEFFDHPTLNVMGVRSDWPQLVTILNKGLATISVEEAESIERKWIGAPEQNEIIEFSKEEQTWLKANPSIKVGIFTLPPYAFVKNGRNQGYLVDLMQLLAGQAGFTPDFSMQALPETFAKVKSGQLHAVLGIMRNDERAGFMYFSKNVLKLEMGIFAQASRSDIRDAASLKHKIIASRTGYGFEHVIKKYLPDAKIIRADDAEGMLRLVASGEADATIRERHSGEYILQDSFMNNVNVKGFFTPPGLPETTGAEFAVSRKFPLLNSILNKAYHAIPESEKTRVWRKWFASVESQEKMIELTEEEQTWIEKNHTVRIRVASWPPYLIVRGNEPPQGIVIEYLKLIEARTGITFNSEVTDQPFAEFLEQMQQRQGPDMTALIINTPGREEYLSFTKPYISSPYVIFSREQDELIMDINGLTEKTIAVPRGFIVEELLTRDYPEIKRVLFDSDEQALQAVATSQADAYIGSLTAASHIIQKRGLTDLRVVAPTPFGNQVFSMGNRSDWPELTSVINKVLSSITEAEKTAIHNKYVAVRYDQGINRAKVLRWILIVAGGAFGVVILFVFWNRSLATRVRQRTVELENTTESLKTEIAERNRIETALKISRRFTDDLIETANVMIVGLDDNGNVKLFNPAAEKITGYTITELHGKNWFELLVPKEHYPQVHLEFFRLTAGGLPKSFRNPILTKNGEERVISWSNNEIKEGGQVVGTLSFGIDITSGLQAEQEILQYQQRLKALAFQLTIAEEKERSKIAVGLHDHIGHSLALARMQLNGILESESHLERKILVKDISNIMLQALQDTRSLIFDLSSPSMNEIGLGAAISEWLREQIEKRHGLKTEFSDQVAEEKRGVLDKNVRALVFRNVRELLTNVVKHARAKQVGVSLREHTDGVEIIVEDDGKGFDPETVKTRNVKTGGFGLFSIQERMSDLGGTVDIQSAPGKGCRAVLTVPVVGGGGKIERPTFSEN